MQADPLSFAPAAIAIVFAVTSLYYSQKARRLVASAVTMTEPMSDDVPTRSQRAALAAAPYDAADERITPGTTRALLSRGWLIRRTRPTGQLRTFYERTPEGDDALARAEAST